jgi:hypothetical protein
MRPLAPWMNECVVVACTNSFYMPSSVHILCG